MADLPNGATRMQENADDISVATATAENRNIVYTKEPKEYVAKFVFKPKNSETNTEVAKTHYKLLQAIKEIYPDVKIFDSYNEEINKFPTLKSYAEYLRHFNLQFVKQNEKKNRKSLYLCFHRIITPVSLSEIRRHTIIATLLSKVNTQLTTHLWKEDETRIANLGFHVGVDPSNHLKEDFENSIRKKIAAVTNRNIKNIPHFQCAFTSPYLMDENGNKTSSKSYDIQCRQQDAAELIKLLQQTYQVNPTFIFHKMRHQNLTAYRNAIRKQNLYLSRSRVVPIQGVHEEQMFYLENELLASNGILSALRHKLSEKTGRWSIMTTEQDFKEVCDLLKNNLSNWTAKITNDYSLTMDTSHLPPIGLAFKNQPYDDESDGSFRSYLSACSSIYSLDDDTHDFPPITDKPMVQAWGPAPIPEVLHSTASQSVSGISQDEYDRMARENQNLNRKIEELTIKMKSFERQKPTTTPPIDIQSIIDATTSAVMSQLMRMQDASQPTDNMEEEIQQPLTQPREGANKRRATDDVEENEQPQGGANNSNQEEIDPREAALDVSMLSTATADPDEHP
jgi:hypothetical protein